MPGDFKPPWCTLFIPTLNASIKPQHTDTQFPPKRIAAFYWWQMNWGRREPCSRVEQCLSVWAWRLCDFLLFRTWSALSLDLPSFTCLSESAINKRLARHRHGDTFPSHTAVSLRPQGMLWDLRTVTLTVQKNKSIKLPLQPSAKWLMTSEACFHLFGWLACLLWLPRACSEESWRQLARLMSNWSSKRMALTLPACQD